MGEVWGVGGWGECKVYSHIKLITVLPEEKVRLVCVRMCVCVCVCVGGGGGGKSAYKMVLT